MKLDKRTWCPISTCQGEFKRIRFMKGDDFFHDECDTCGARKATGVQTGNIAYFDESGRLIPELRSTS